MTSAPRWIARNRIAVFVAIAYAFTWTIGGMSIARRAGLIDAPDWLHYVAAHGPLVAAFVVTAWADGGAGLRDLLARLVRVTFRPVWWIAALSPLWITLLVHAGMLIATGSGLDLAALGVIDGVGDLGVLGAAGFWALTFGLGEETGWRGFLQHQLDARQANRNNALIVGLIWAGWHLPYFFYDANYMAMGAVMIFGWFMGIMAGAVVLAWVYQGTGNSILAVIMWHALFNLSNGAATGRDLLAPLLSVLVIVAAIALRNVQARRDAASAKAA